MRTRIADDYKAIAEHLGKRLKEREKEEPQPWEYENGYFFDMLQEKHRGMVGRVLIMHSICDTTLTERWSICKMCNPNECSCAMDRIADEVDEYDPNEHGFPDLYFCKDCP